MDMDKTSYVKGLLAFYELNRMLYSTSSSGVETTSSNA